MKSTSHLLAVALAALLPALALTVPSVASADAIQLTNPTATFDNIAGGYNTSGEGTNEIHWGTATNNSNNPGHLNSGLRFDPFVSPLNTTTETPFDLGVLTHFNWEISLPGASGADLTFSFSIPGASIDPLNFLFNLGVDETSNVQQGCANTPVPPGNWCPDIISFAQMTSSTVFTLNGQSYTLKLLGFGDAPNNLSNNFITQEFANNTTHLWAVITPNVSVPEPGALGMMGLGLLGLVGLLAIRRRKLMVE